jgi:hypothetical protein
MGDEVTMEHLADLRDEVDRAAQRFADLVAERDRLRAVVTTLNARYVDHMDECAVKVDYPCDCGLDDVLRQLDVSPTMGVNQQERDHEPNEEPTADDGGDHGRRDDRAHPDSARAIRDAGLSPTMGGRCPDCGNPLRHCDCSDRIDGGCPARKRRGRPDLQPWSTRPGERGAGVLGGAGPPSTAVN